MGKLGAYCRIVASRALSPTLAAIRQPPANMGEHVALVVVIAAFAIVLSLIADKGGAVLLGVASAGLVAAIALLYQLIATAAAIWEEQTEELLALRKAMATNE